MSKNDELTLESLKDNGWRAALAFTISADTPVKLLEEARSQVVQYMDWVSDYWPGKASVDDITKEINRAAARLKAISTLLAVGRVVLEVEE